MKNLLFLFTFYLIAQLAPAQTDCQKFKTGKFKNIEKGKDSGDYIERNDSIQTEKHGEGIIKLKVTWIDDCSYRLTFLEANEAWWNNSLYLLDNPMPDLLVKITFVGKNAYEQESHFEGKEAVYKSTLLLIE